jgi:hypothetical protein
VKHWLKVILVLLCAGSLFYFDSRETIHVRNNDKFRSDSDISIRIGDSRMRSICFVSTKKDRKRVKCPLCKWAKTMDKKIYKCTDSNIKRALVFTYRGRK